MSAQQRAVAAADLPPGKVVGVGRYAVGNAGGRYFAVTRRCRHLGADLAGGSIDENGCLVCPWHRSAYDAQTAAALSLAVTGSGAFTGFETHELIEAGDLAQIAERAKQISYQPPGV
jgi:nitrite reductase/ring-hydroxylating ferredoxin subunit